MVRLKARGTLRKPQGLLFQFHYGTIKRLNKTTEKVNELHFNSTMVRLKVSGDTESPTAIRNFNSTMVRLKGHIE